MPKITTKLTHTKRPLNFYSSIKNAIHSKWIVSLSSDGYAHCGSSNVLKNDGVGTFGFGNPSAWCVLSKTINNQDYQFCIQNDGYMGLRVKYSKLGFANNTDTLIHSPVATDQEVLVGGGTDIVPTYQQISKSIMNFHMNEVLIMLTDKNGNVIKFSLKPPFVPKTPSTPAKFIINKILT